MDQKINLAKALADKNKELANHDTSLFIGLERLSDGDWKSTYSMIVSVSRDGELWANAEISGGLVDPSKEQAMEKSLNIMGEYLDSDSFLQSIEDQLDYMDTVQGVVN